MNSQTGVTEQTLAAVQQALARPMTIAPGDVLAKTATTQGITTGTGLVGYLLEEGARLLFPVLSPLRNRFARHQAPIGATAVHWKAITGINTANLKAGVVEGLRNSVISTSEVNKTQTFKTIGFDNSVTFEAIQAGRGFDDVRALATANTLSALMVGEEKIILGGNVTAIAKPASVSATSTTGGSLSNSTTYDYAVSALTLFGYLDGADGRAGSTDSPDETDGRTGSTATGGSGTALALTWPAVRGAVAYNVFAGTSSGTKYYIATVTVPAYTLTALVGSGNVPNVADQTADSLSFDGIIPQISDSGAGSYWRDLANAQLTGDNAGGIVEIDVMLKSLYDTSRIGPTMMLVNSQQGQDLLAKVAANGSTTVLRLNAAVGPDGIIRGGLILGSYLNKFTGTDVEIRVHPYMAPGTIIAISERLPFPNNNVGNPFELEVSQEYTAYDWALTQRKYEFGVYANEALKVYFPAGCGVITGIKAG